MTELNKPSNRKNYFGGTWQSVRNPAQAGLSHWCCSQEGRRLKFTGGAARPSLKGSAGSAGEGGQGGEAASGGQALIKARSGLMRDDLCKQWRVKRGAER